jgi:hypothetical protein
VIDERDIVVGNMKNLARAGGPRNGKLFTQGINGIIDCGDIVEEWLE